MNRELLKAIRFATLHHRDQRRSAVSTEFVPYMVHPLEVIDILMSVGVTNTMVLTVAALHDIIEDTDCTYEDVFMMFGKQVAEEVKLLTVPKNVIKLDYQINSMIIGTHTTALVKVADKTSNVRDLVNNPPAWNLGQYQRYIDNAKKVVIAAIDQHSLPQALIQQFWETYTQTNNWIKEREHEENK